MSEEASLLCMTAAVTEWYWHQLRSLQISKPRY